MLRSIDNHGLDGFLAEIYVVRHAQASLGAENYDQLSELGYQQSDWLGEYFAAAGLSFDQVYRGDMARHRQTLAGIRNRMPEACSPEQVLTGLNEFDFKALVKAYLFQYPGQTPAKPFQAKDYYRLLKAALQLWSQDQLGNLPDGSCLPESWEQFRQRVMASYQQIQQQIQQQSGGKTLVVSSGGANAMLLAQVLQAPAQTMIELNLQSLNTGINHFYANGQTLRLSRFNHVPHLDIPQRRSQMTYG